MEYAPVKINDSQLIREGTIVVTRRNPANDFFMDRILKFTHLGIVAVEDGGFVVYDLHPDNKNGNKGSLDKKKFDEYMKGRVLIGTHHTGASTARIQAVAERCWNRKYDTFDFNCQKFIDYVTHKELSSDLVNYYTGICLLLGVAGAVVLGGTIYMLATAGEKSK